MFHINKHIVFVCVSFSKFENVIERPAPQPSQRIRKRKSTSKCIQIVLDVVFAAGACLHQFMLAWKHSKCVLLCVFMFVSGLVFVKHWCSNPNRVPVLGRRRHGSPLELMLD